MPHPKNCFTEGREAKEKRKYDFFVIPPRKIIDY
jgi:hypothetical protein